MTIAPLPTTRTPIREEDMLAVGGVLLDACQSDKGMLHPWKPFNIAQVSRACINAYLQSSGVLERVAELEAEVKRKDEALQLILDRYVGLVNSGDAGFWNPEEEPQVIAARQALSPAPSTSKKDLA